MAEGEPDAVGEEQLDPGATETVEAPAEFQVPEAVADALLGGNLAIFAGAGAGIDAAFPFTFAQDVMGELGLDPAGDLAFPDIMTAYEQRNGRIALLERIKERSDYVKSFRELDEDASRFARELSSAFTIDTIYTTDWDDTFERACGAVAFAAERDWAFWRFGARKVFKLHGSVNSPASIVATDADYRQCYGGLDTSLVWEKLETTLKTKTVVFVGYGFHDADFNSICGAIAHRMEELIERCYVVTLDDSEPSPVAGHMHILRTDPLTFVRKLKECYPAGDYVPDERFEAISDFREDVRMERAQMLEHGDLDGETLLAAAYQDGLIHACDHIESNKPNGRYSFRGYTDRKVEMYAELRRAKLEAKEYEDVAYVDGYVNGLAFLTADDAEREAIPLYVVFGHDGTLSSHEEFREAAARAASLDADAHEHAEQRAAALPAGTRYQHSTFIF